jgi:hypothetical protein
MCSINIEVTCNMLHYWKHCAFVHVFVQIGTKLAVR